MYMIDGKREILTVSQKDLPKPKTIIDKSVFDDYTGQYLAWVNDPDSLDEDAPALCFKGISPSTSRQSADEYNKKTVIPKKIKNKNGEIVDLKTRQRRTPDGEVLYVYFDKTEG